MRSQISYGNGMYKSTDAGKTLDAHRPRQHATDRPRPRRSAEPRRRLRRRARSRLRRQPGSRRLSHARRRRDLAEGAVQEQRRRRDRSHLRSGDVADDLRVAVEHPPSAVEHLSAVVRAGQRALQVDRRRRQLAAADRAACRPTASAASASRSRRPTAAASTRSSTRRKAASFDPTMPARRSRRCRATRASGDAAGTSARSSSIRRTPTSSTSRTPASTGRATAAGRSASRSRDRRAATTTTSCGSRPTTRNRMILGGDQGAVISVDGLNDHPTWSSWLNQPTAQIYRVAVDNAFPVLGDRRAAGQRRGPRPLARPLRRHHDARLGAAVRRRRERLHRARSAATRTSSSAARWRSATSTPARSSAFRPKWICRRRRATPGRCRWCSRRPIRTRCISAISTCSRRPTAASTGRASATT